MANSDQFEISLYLHILIGLGCLGLWYLGAWLLDVDIDGRTRSKTLGIVSILIGAVCLLTNLWNLAFGSPLTFCRFR